MVISPKRVSQNDPDWRKVCALLKVLPLDPRNQAFGKCFVKNEAYFTSAAELLERPFITVDRRKVPASYFTYVVPFAVSVTIGSSIDCDSGAELAEFTRALDEALSGPLTIAERRRWEAYCKRNRLPRSWDRTLTPEKADLWVVQNEEDGNAMRYYTEVRHRLEAEGRFEFVKCQFTLTMEELVRYGETLLEAV